MSVVFDLPLFWLYLGQRVYWREVSYTAAYKRHLGLRIGRLFFGFMWISRESVPVYEHVLPTPTKPEPDDQRHEGDAIDCDIAASGGDA